MEPEDYSGFKTLGTDIDDAYTFNEWDTEEDVDEVIEDNYSDE